MQLRVAATAPKLREQRREALRRSSPAASPSRRSTSIAACESGGDPTAVSADGTYRGKYQFDYGTWESVGGIGDPAQLPSQSRTTEPLCSTRGRAPAPGHLRLAASRGRGARPLPYDLAS